jgi:hypothetical protein
LRGRGLQVNGVEMLVAAMGRYPRSQQLQRVGCKALASVRYVVCAVYVCLRLRAR